MFLSTAVNFFSRNADYGFCKASKLFKFLVLLVSLSFFHLLESSAYILPPITSLSVSSGSLLSGIIIGARSPDASRADQRAETALESGSSIFPSCGTAFTTIPAPPCHAPALADMGAPPSSHPGIASAACIGRGGVTSQLAPSPWFPSPNHRLTTIAVTYASSLSGWYRISTFIFGLPSNSDKNFTWSIILGPCSLRSSAASFSSSAARFFVSAISKSLACSSDFSCVSFATVRSVCNRCSLMFPQTIRADAINVSADTITVSPKKITYATFQWAIRLASVSTFSDRDATLDRLFIGFITAIMVSATAVVVTCVVVAYKILRLSATSRGRDHHRPRQQ